MRTYKFLAKGAIGPVSRFQWPQPQPQPQPQDEAPGAWVQSDGPLELCANGAHVCRPLDLAHWLHDELWETEAEGEEIEGLDCLVVRRARLVRRIDGWHQGGSARFAEACARHVVELADRAPHDKAAVAREYLDDALFSARSGFVAASAHGSAVAAAKLADPGEQEHAYRRERVWQSEWIARVLLSE